MSVYNRDNIDYKSILGAAQSGINAAYQADLAKKKAQSDALSTAINAYTTYNDMNRQAEEDERKKMQFDWAKEDHDWQTKWGEILQKAYENKLANKQNVYNKWLSGESLTDNDIAIYKGGL